MTLLIRPMQQGDLAQVRTLIAACPEAPQWPAASYLNYLDATEEGAIRRVALIAEYESNVAGFAAVSLLLDPPGEAAAENRCELESIAVLPRVRRHGVGSLLLRAVLAWADANAARRLVLEVRAGNAAALALYQRSGLWIEGRRPKYYADPAEDALLLGVQLPQEQKRDDFSTENSIEGGPPQC